MRLLSAFLSLFAVLGAFATPTKSMEKRQIQTLSPGAIATFKPYSFYAASAYCDPSVLETWTCGGTYRRFNHDILYTHRCFHDSQL